MCEAGCLHHCTYRRGRRLNDNVRKLGPPPINSNESNSSRQRRRRRLQLPHSKYPNHSTILEQKPPPPPPRSQATTGRTRSSKHFTTTTTTTTAAAAGRRSQPIELAKRTGVLLLLFLIYCCCCCCHLVASAGGESAAPNATHTGGQPLLVDTGGSVGVGQQASLLPEPAALRLLAAAANNLDDSAADDDTDGGGGGDGDASDHDDNSTAGPEPGLRITPTPTTTTTTTSTTTRRPQLARRAPPSASQQPWAMGRVSETDLLPFSDFVVQQPAFSELMRSWPPTTKQYARQLLAAAEQQASRSHSSSSSSSSGFGGLGGQPHRQLRRPSSTPAAYNANRKLQRGPQMSQTSETGGAVRNHLNEDLDDTIVTADESFELDQLAEPPTWVNYMGELGDFIYLQLRQFIDHSARSPFFVAPSRRHQDSAGQPPGGGQESAAAGRDARQPPPPPASGGPKTLLPFETIDDLLDDFYYDQYENSQVLYYGPQLVREGDIFEIGCYLPLEQAAEWTKSGKLLQQSRHKSSSYQADSNNHQDTAAAAAAATGGGGGGNNNGAQIQQQQQQQPTELANHSLTSITITAPNGSPRVIRRADFLGAKQNFTLKIFEAQLADTGNYRCTRMSRKFHKLIVVPQRVSTQQLYLIQQRLLSVVNPARASAAASVGHTGSLVSSSGAGHLVAASLAAYARPPPSHQPGASAAAAGGPVVRPTIQASGSSGGGGLITSSQLVSSQQQQQQQQQQLLARQKSTSAARAGGQLPLLLPPPGHLIVEGHPLLVACNISDEFILRRLREQPHFQLAWYKNGRLLRGSQPRQAAAAAAASGPTGAAGAPSQARGQHQQQPRQQQQQQQPSISSTGSQARVQFLGPNGRQLYISSATYADAGDYLCSWSRLPTRQMQDPLDDDNATLGGVAAGQESPAGQPLLVQQQQQQQPPMATIATNPLAAGSQFQLVAPVKLRPFKSAYHVRQGHQLRLVCQVQRGFPAAQITWYIGNRLVDGDFLREHPNEFRILQMSNGERPSVVASPAEAGPAGQPSQQDAEQQQPAGGGAGQSGTSRLVEINPIPSGRLQMSLTANGRGSWVDYRDLASDKYAIETRPQQLRYLQTKLAQLTGISLQQQQQHQFAAAGQASDGSSAAAATTMTIGDQMAIQMASPSPSTSTSSSSLGGHQPLSQAGLSVLVINSLDAQRHSSRYSCRATSRANTDEVTTVIRVKEFSTIVVRPNNGAATLVPGQPLHFECAQIDNQNAQFLWYKRHLTEPEGPGAMTLLEPITDENIEIHNERLTLMKPTYQSIGDYTCRALNEDKTLNENEFATIRVRQQPYIDDFHIDTSHTGKSAVLTDGDRLELVCRVYDEAVPVNITWLRSTKSDDESQMIPIAEVEAYSANSNSNGPFPTLALSSLQQQQQQQQQLQLQLQQQQQQQEAFMVPTYGAQNNVIVERINNFTKKLIIESVGPEHRSYYSCMVDNGVTERARKTIFIRVKDKIVALWPLLGIVAELFILFTIIYVWETQKAHKEILTGDGGAASGADNGPKNGTPPLSATTTPRRPVGGPINALENVPLNR